MYVILNSIQSERKFTKTLTAVNLYLDDENIDDVFLFVLVFFSVNLNVSSKIIMAFTIRKNNLRYLLGFQCK